MDEMDKKVLKEKIDEVFAKVEKYGTQAEQYAKTNDELTNLINEQGKLKDTFLDVANSYKEFIEYVDKTYNEVILLSCKESFDKIKAETDQLVSRIDSFEEIIDAKSDEVKDKIDSLFESGEKNKQNIIDNIKDLSNKILELNSDIESFKEDIQVIKQQNEEEHKQIMKTNKILVGLTIGVAIIIIAMFVVLLVK